MQNNFKNSLFLLFSMHSDFLKIRKDFNLLEAAVKIQEKQLVSVWGIVWIIIKKQNKSLPENQKSKITFSVY